MDMPIDVQHQTMGYDRTATMFSPEGTILQVEYAQKTVRLGSSSIGMKCSDGVFIISDKRSEDSLVAKKSASKISEIDEHVIATSAGIVSDARILIEKAQILAQQHRVTYDGPIEPELLIKEIANAMQQFTQYGGARPFGVAIMMAGINEDEPELYISDITGNYLLYNANAIGENDLKMKDKLREKYKESLDIKKGAKIALEILEETREKKFDIKRFEIAYIQTKDQIVKRVNGEELKDFIK